MEPTRLSRLIRAVLVILSLAFIGLIVFVVLTEGVDAGGQVAGIAGFAVGVIGLVIGVLNDGGSRASLPPEGRGGSPQPSDWWRAPWRWVRRGGGLWLSVAALVLVLTLIVVVLTSVLTDGTGSAGEASPAGPAATPAPSATPSPDAPSARWEAWFPGDVPACLAGDSVADAAEPAKVYGSRGTYFGTAEWRIRQSGPCGGYQWVVLHVEHEMALAQPALVLRLNKLENPLGNLTAAGSDLARRYGLGSTVPVGSYPGSMLYAPGFQTIPICATLKGSVRTEAGTENLSIGRPGTRTRWCY